MKLNDLKTGFWGYKKDQVCQYITSIEEGASARLAEKDAQLSQLEQRSRTQIEKLEQSLREAREEIEQLHAAQLKTADILPKADTPKEESQSGPQDNWNEERVAVRVYAQTIRDGILKYSSRLDSFQKTLRGMLEDLDEQARRIELSVDSSAADAAYSERARIPNLGQSSTQKTYPFEHLRIQPDPSQSQGTDQSRAEE